MPPAEISRRHPCFCPGAQGRYGRIHLPVAASCNLVCAYCRRDYDCPHESRPGVSSRLLSPEQALAHLANTLRSMPFLSVVGIAGPGDPFCHPRTTLRCLELVHRAYPELLLCLATNGLNLLPHIPRLVELGVRHVTLTMNALEPEVAARLHPQARLEGRRLQGREAAVLLLERQLASLVELKALGVAVKVNTVLVPGVNLEQVPELARTVAGLGADLMNLIPLIPVAGTPLAGTRPPSAGQIRRLREQAGAYLPQMSHCRRCRADAVGLLCPPSSPPWPA